MRILALDHGTKRVGVAVSDEMHVIACPMEFIPADPFPEFLVRLRAIVQEKEVGRIVVGLPRNMDGSYGPAAQKVREFMAILEREIALPVQAWDERLTSTQANRAMVEAGMRREQRKAKADQTAAAILLQSYLDSV